MGAGEPPGSDGLLADSTLGFASNVAHWLATQQAKTKGAPVFRTRLVGRKCVVVTGHDACAEALLKHEFVASEAYSELLSGILGETTLLTMRDDADGTVALKGLMHRVLIDTLREFLFETFVPKLKEGLNAAGGNFVSLYEVVRDAVADAIVEQVLGPHHLAEREQVGRLLKEHFRASSSVPIRGGIGTFLRTGFQKGVDAREDMLRRLREVVHDTQASGEQCSPSCSSLLCNIFMRRREQLILGGPTPPNEHIAGLLLVLSNSIIPKTVATLVASTAAAIVTESRSLLSELRSDTGSADATLQEVYAAGSRLDRLRWCIREAGRLWPALVAAPRKCVVDTTFLGHRIPRDRYVIIMLLSANRDRTKYGTHSDRFDPLRWCPENGAGPAEPLTFGGGLRSCGGRPLAEAFAEVALLHLVRSYPQWTLKSGAKNTDDSFKWLPVAAHREPLQFRFCT